MCTVTRPGLAPIAAATAVELLASVLQHPQGYVPPFLTLLFRWLTPSSFLLISGYTRLLHLQTKTSPALNPTPNKAGASSVSYHTNSADSWPSSAIYCLRGLRMISVLDVAKRYFFFFPILAFLPFHLDAHNSRLF